MKAFFYSQIIFHLFWLAPNFGQNVDKELSFTPHLLCIDNNEACSVADINRDGLPDVVAGRLWYAAPDFIPRPVRALETHPPDYARNNGEHTVDVDGDGWLDVMATGWGETRLQWWKNPGEEGLTKGLPWIVYDLADTDIPTGEIGLMHDIDGDGVQEYIMNSYDKTKPFSIWRTGTDSHGVPQMLGSIIGKDNSHGVGFGDLNGDGRTDVLYDYGWFEQPAQEIWGGQWKLHSDWKWEGAGCPMQVVDLNEDGRSDVIWGKGHDYGLYWMEQGDPSGDATTWTTHLIDSSWSQIHALTWADLDDDGQGELITGKRIWAHSGKDPGSADPPHIYRYEWNKATQSFDRQIISSGKIGTGLMIRVADLNADGKQDLVVAGKTGTYILWQD